MASRCLRELLLAYPRNSREDRGDVLLGLAVSYLLLVPSDLVRHLCHRLSYLRRSLWAPSLTEVASVRPEEVHLLRLELIPLGIPPTALDWIK